ncbi:glycoside-pentoside-hexuronide (GPH):cation symporter [Ruminococcaceae bacterium OttesenSCG-928-I18]|nr:glycoside-pentoside-hexuronide (GPH):cation symporter [Ruminococcaceae bacterium OttesenSCG-928-I18]
MNTKMKTWEKISYGMGDLANNLMFGPVAYYLLYFYTDVAGISLALVSLLMGVARAVDAVASPFIGGLVDRTNTRWGKTRPYLLFTTLPLGVLMVLCFLVPNASMNAVALYALFTYLGFSLLYTLNNVAYLTLLTVMTPDNGIRLQLGGIRMAGMAVGSLVANGLLLPIILLLGSGNERRGFALTALLFGIVSVLLLMNCFLFTRERIEVVPERGPLLGSMRTMGKSRPFLILCTVQILGWVMQSFFYQNTVFYAKYLLHNEQFAAAMMALPTLCLLGVSPFISLLARRFGKRRFMAVSYAASAAALLLVWAAGDRVWLVLPGSMLAGFGTGCALSMGILTCSDTIDHVEWLTGKKLQGLMTSMMLFAAKLGLVVTGTLSPFVLGLGGYVANAEQSLTALMAIRTNYIFLPVLLGLLCLFLLRFYRLDERQMENITNELVQRRFEKASQQGLK